LLLLKPVKLDALHRALERLAAPEGPVDTTDAD
jgi:hypothetical protein